MAEITKATGLDTFVDNNKFDFGRVNLEDILKFSIQYKGDPDYIHYLENGCNCTEIFYNKENNCIEGQVTVSKIYNKDSTPKGVRPISKVASIMLDPTQHYLVAGPRKEKIVNNDKPFIRIYLNGTVLIE